MAAATTPATAGGIQYIHDRNKANWVRNGDQILKFGAMVIFDGELVFGVGSRGTFPNLVYADWDTYTEVGELSSTTDLFRNNAYSSDNITASYLSKNFDGDIPDCKKQITDITIVYRSKTAWTYGHVNIKYRIDQGSWTTLGSSHVTAQSDNNTHLINYPHLSVTPGYNFQFKIESVDTTASEGFEILKVIIYYNVHTKQ